MEDFFQILIFIVYIIIMIISANKKRKKKAQKQKVGFPASSKSGATNLPHVKKQKSQQEIFEELFGIKPKPATTQAETTKQTAKVETSTYKTWYAEDDFKPKKHNDNYSFRKKDKFEKEEFQEESLEHDVFYVRKKNKFKEKAQKTKEQLEQERLAHKAIKESKLKKKEPKKNKYQKLFDNPSTLKDYIVISEILNKPKALRR